VATLYISEFSAGGATIGTTFVEGVLPQPNVADQPVAIGVAHAESNPFNTATRVILLQADAACEIMIGAAPVAVSGTSLRIPANVVPIAFAVQPGHKVSVIQSA
jgi:hypothetical protein